MVNITYGNVEYLDLNQDWYRLSKTLSDLLKDIVNPPQLHENIAIETYSKTRSEIAKYLSSQSHYR
jgi:hypothetical protein